MKYGDEVRILNFHYRHFSWATQAKSQVEKEIVLSFQQYQGFKISWLLYELKTILKIFI